MDNQVRVSIGMPVYNGEAYLSEALESLLAQDYENFELILSDNASTDATSDIGRQFAARDHRVVYHRNESNIGALNNFNRVLELATGKYFMWAAHDDRWEPTYLSTLVRVLELQPEVALAFSAFDNIDAAGRSVRDYPHLFHLASPPLFQRLKIYLLQEERLGKANPIYGLTRRDLLRDVGGFKLWGKGDWGADMLVVFRLLCGGRLVLEPQVLFHKRLPSPAVSSPRGGGPRFWRVMGRLLASWKERSGYFYGYSHIIQATASLSVREKALLNAMVCMRAIQSYVSETKSVVFLPLLRYLILQIQQRQG